LTACHCGSPPFLAASFLRALPPQAASTAGGQRLVGKNDAPRRQRYAAAAAAPEACRSIAVWGKWQVVPGSLLDAQLRCPLVRRPPERRAGPAAPPAASLMMHSHPPTAHSVQRLRLSRSGPAPSSLWPGALGDRASRCVGGPQPLPRAGCAFPALLRAHLSAGSTDLRPPHACGRRRSVTRFRSGGRVDAAPSSATSPPSALQPTWAGCGGRPARG